MGKKRKKKFKKQFEKQGLLSRLTPWIGGVLLVLLAIVIGLSFFEKAGLAGNFFMRSARFLIGETIFIIPLIFVLGALVFLRRGSGEREIGPVILAMLVSVTGAAGILSIFNVQDRHGGWLGYVSTWPFLKYFGFWATIFIFIAPIVVGILIFWHFLKPSQKEEEEVNRFGEEKEEEPKPSIIKKIFAPKFKVKDISPVSEIKEEKQPDLKMERHIPGAKTFAYQPPSINLLEKDRGLPTSGDTRINSSIIKKTLEHFDIDVAMSEVNIGPTVTQYTFKPAEGVKLSKITGLSNDLALALASHPIRIEAPIPGRSLVGVEIPNKIRAQVRLRNLIENPSFQNSSANLILPLGRDVAGLPVYADLTKMPHLLVAGSTGTGKTIFLNSLILSLLYQPSTSFKSAGPELLRFILVDPKRVEFPVYANLPHLLCPVIYNATQTINALKWLTGEMERRFDVLAEGKSRDIGSFNERALKNGTEPLPFIVLIIDELADLMAAKGREIEAGVVRLAQMARAVGIHLIVATQRPSVEVITGLIKANITSRVTCQVASQVDSRTVLDSAGAEKLLGQGDLLYISAHIPKPKRIQGPYISEKEIRKVAGSIKDGKEVNQELIQELGRGTEEIVSSGPSYGEEDSLYEEARKLVIESGRASSSLLQRRLRLGYARAARLIDILEEKGVVGPADGSKPREVYGEKEKEELERLDQPKDNEWKEV